MGQIMCPPGRGDACSGDVVRAGDRLRVGFALSSRLLRAARYPRQVLITEADLARVTSGAAEPAAETEPDPEPVTSSHDVA